jgi:hypothetical protein
MKNPNWKHKSELHGDLNALSEDTATCDQDNNRSNVGKKSDIAEEFDFRMTSNERMVITSLVFLL